MKAKGLDLMTRLLLAGCMAALGLGMALVLSKAWKTAPAAHASPAAPRVDPVRAIYEEGRAILIRNSPASAAGKFSDSFTDANTGAAELGNGIWEAWGRVEATAGGATEWHVAWDRKTGRVIYRKLGKSETGNYAEALEASKAYPVSNGPD